LVPKKNYCRIEVFLATKLFKAKLKAASLIFWNGGEVERIKIDNIKRPSHQNKYALISFNPIQTP